MTERFLDDMAGLSPHLFKKCRDLVRELSRADEKHFMTSGLPGWRLHKLKNSPFRSLSIDMNFRVLAKWERDAAFLHRVVKHDSADNPDVNRNDGQSYVCDVARAALLPNEIFEVLEALGLPRSEFGALGRVQSEDELLDVLATLSPKWAHLPLDLYETSCVQIPSAKYRLFDASPDFESSLKRDLHTWELYLHPSQRFVVELPHDQRICVTGSAGTGKTVCAWHRIQRLSGQGLRVGLVVPSEATLQVSRSRLTELLQQSPGATYFLVAHHCDELLQISDAVDHLVIDEGQELSPLWYERLSDHLNNTAKGLSIFCDLNQLRGNILVDDVDRYKERHSRWDIALNKRLSCTNIVLGINYRNSREIAEYYTTRLGKHLLEPLSAELAAFEAGEVIQLDEKDPEQALTALVYCVKRLKREFSDEEIAIVPIGTKSKSEEIARQLAALGVSCRLHSSECSAGLLVSTPELIRGHERKAIVVYQTAVAESKCEVGFAIRSYIALVPAPEID